MARLGRPTVEIRLSGNERKTLERWARRHTTSQALALRCRIILACSDAERSRDDIAAEVGCNPVTVTKWRNRFASDRLDGLMDAPRPGAARTITDEVVEQVLVDTLETTPGEDTHWSTRGLAAKHGISRQTVSEIWRAFGLKPWRQGEFKVSPDPQLVEKIRDLAWIHRLGMRVEGRASAESASRSGRMTVFDAVQTSIPEGTFCEHNIAQY